MTRFLSLSLKRLDRANSIYFFDSTHHGQPPRIFRYPKKKTFCTNVISLHQSWRSHIPEERPQGIRRQQIIRQSARLQALQQLHKQYIPKSNHMRELLAPPSLPTSKTPRAEHYVPPLLILPCRIADLINFTTAFTDPPPILKAR